MDSVTQLLTVIGWQKLYYVQPITNGQMTSSAGLGRARDATHVAPFLLTRRQSDARYLAQREICRGLLSEVGSCATGGAAHAQSCDAGCGRCGGGLPRGAAPGGLRGSTRSR